MKIAFDTGGTFTDFAMLDALGRIHLHKILSTPDDPVRAVMAGIDELLGRLPSHARREDILFLAATTVATNAVLERKGARTAFLTTNGFRDILRIRTEARYDFYSLQIAYPEPLVPRNFCFGINERITADGTKITPLDKDEVRRVAHRLRALHVEAAAVCFLHSYQHPDHEQQVAAILAEEVPEISVSLSSAVAPEMREYSRASTTVIDAYVKPVIQRHVTRLKEELERRGIRRGFFFMTSAGGLVPDRVAAEAPVRLIESGPAAGSVVAAEYGLMAGERNILSFDMGGTTAKLCLIQDGQPVIGRSLEVARAERFKSGSGFPLNIQSVQLIEIGAGGGSIAVQDQLGLLKVGPQSAAAMPGPACYGRGGRNATVTDADALLGYVASDSFLGGKLVLDIEAAKRAVGTVASELGISRERCAWGIHDLVNENMSKAAAAHVAESGADPRLFTVVAFGGAGPVHARGVAKKLGIRRVICPLGAGVASAIGLLVAPVTAETSLSSPMRMAQWDFGAVRRILTNLAQQGEEMVASAGVPQQEIACTYSVDLRHAGQGHELTVEVPSLDLPDSVLRATLLENFFSLYQKIYGRRVEGSELEILTWRARSAGRKGELRNYSLLGELTKETGGIVNPTRAVYFAEANGSMETPVYDHYSLTPGTRIIGPAIIQQRESTTVAGPDDQIEIDDHLNAVIHLSQKRDS